jgi:hypothetical protein
MGYKDLTPEEFVGISQGVIGNSPSGLLSENVIKIMKNKEKILNAFTKVHKNFRSTK